MSSSACSCVLRIVNNRHATLLTGDIKAAQERALIAVETPEQLMADILLVPRHGSKTSPSGALLDVVSPQVTVLQVGYRNRYEHPHLRIWQYYIAHGIDGLRTDKTGAVAIQTGGDALGIQTAHAVRPHYWSSAREVDPLATATDAFDAPSWGLVA